MFHNFKIQTHHGHEEGRIFSHLALLLGFSSAVFWAILPNYANFFSNNDFSLAGFFAIISGATLLGAIFSTVLFKRFVRANIFKVALIFEAFVFFLMIFVNSYTGLLVLEAIRSFINVQLWIALALFVRDCSTANELGRSEGKFFLFINLGFILGFFLSSLILIYFHLHIIFLTASFIVVMTFLYFSFKHVKFRGHIVDSKENTSFLEFCSNIRDYFRDRNRVKSYLMGFGLSYWLILSAIYIPIFVLARGFNENLVGYVLGATIIPLIFMEEFAANRSDTKGMKLFLITGFLFLAGTAILLGLNPPSLIMIGLMIISGFGVGMIEPLQEKYFFTVTSHREENKFYGVRMTSSPLAGIFAPVIAALTFGFLGLAGVWITAGIVMFIMALFVLSIRKSF